MILDAIKATMPSFVSRVERPDRGGEWVAYLERRRDATERWVARLGLDRREAAEDRPSVRLLHVDGDEDRLLAALLFEEADRRRGRHAGGGARRCPTRSAPARWPTSWASGATAATAPAAASRRCATASRSSPTTARSATSSATGCSPCSGRR